MRDALTIALIAIGSFVLGAILLIILSLALIEHESVSDSTLEGVTNSTVWVSYTWRGIDSEGNLVDGGSTGSGVIHTSGPQSFSAITSRHVIDCRYTFDCGMKVHERVRIRTQDGQLHNITRIRYAPAGIDLALIEANTANIQYRPAQHAGDPAYAGTVIAVGYPAYANGAVEFRIDQGQITSRKQLLTDEGIEITSIESDAYTYSGSSGGGLFTSDGKLLGISTWAGDGFSTAIATESFPPTASFMTCDKGYLYSNSECAPYCSADSILNEDLECIGACDDFYCQSTPPPITTDECPAGYILDENDSCQPACGGNFYCKDSDAWCYQDTCVTCAPDHVLFEDGKCY